MGINDLFSFQNVKLNRDLLDEIWSFDPNTLESKDDVTISRYAIGLAQYLVYFRSEYNRNKAVLAKKKQLLDASLVMALDNSKDIKGFKTKAAATEYLITTDSKLSVLNEEINNLKEELTYLEGVDKSVSEYIATFKRDLTRREKELNTVRSERRN